MRAVFPSIINLLLAATEWLYHDGDLAEVAASRVSDRKTAYLSLIPDLVMHSVSLRKTLILFSFLGQAIFLP